MSALPSLKIGANKEITDRDMEILKIRSRLDEKEIRELHSEFWRNCPDGKMTSRQYETYCQNLDPNNAIRKLHHELGFLLFDTDRNDEIDFVEFLMANAFATSKTRHEALSYVFDMCDYTQDGRMDMNELLCFSTVAVASAKSTLHTSTLKTMRLAADIIRFIEIAMRP
ncbi:unnamed protein product [Rotaria sordida]|uniref:Uncharacterized protein n=1 Tax=Rotaria sordida TaxID=392033 RepID=A0A814KK17_9BILA|nr:unnamed protein product [Rotaria sordida]